MSETIYWQTFPDKDKVRLIIEQVFKYRIDDIHQGSNEQPVAFWDEQDGRWQLDDGEDTISFDPLHHMEDAWQIVEELYEQYNVVVKMNKNSTCRYSVSFLSHDGSHEIGCNSNASLHGAICIAALRAVGVEVLTDEPLQG